VKTDGRYRLPSYPPLSKTSSFTPQSGPTASRFVQNGDFISGYAAKNDAVLHIFSMNAFYIRFEANGAFYAGLQNAIVRFCEAKLKGAGGVARSRGTEHLFWGSGFFPKT
jgi:hypothetical protein